MKNSLIVSICLVALTVGVFAQNAAAQTSSPAPDTSVTPTATASVSPSSDLADKIHQRLEKKFGRHHGIVIDGHDSDEGSHGDIPEQVFPIVGITMITVFGAPVAIVAVIMLINYFKARSLHRTVQSMVEKGQPVPEALLASPALPRPRSDLRRGIILVMVGLGIAIFLMATDWGGSSWSLGAIPFLVGLGYLLVWKLEVKKNDKPPPLP